MRALVVCILLAAAVPAGAAERLHTVIHGESVSGIAKHYYGDFSHTDLLLRFNGRAANDLRPGEKLRIPYCKEHRIRPGDNGSTLAQRYLGRGTAWEAIARLNGLVPEAPLQPGRTLSIPLVLRHTLVGGDSLSGLAETYYGEPGRSSLLQAFNDIANPRDLSVGNVVMVPIVGVTLVERLPEPTVTAKPEPKPVLPDWFENDFLFAESAYRKGDYDTARAGIESLVERIDDIPIAEKRSEVWRLAAFVEVAFDDGERACASFESMRSTGAPVNLDPDRVSPKILEALKECGSR